MYSIIYKNFTGVIPQTPVKGEGRGGVEKGGERRGGRARERVVS